MNSNAWRGNFQQPKHGRKTGEEKGEGGEVNKIFVMAILNACGCFANWELQLKSIVSVAHLTEEKRAEEAETKNQELEVQIGHPSSVKKDPFFIAVQRAPPNPHVF